MYSNYCCSCSFEPEIIKIGQLSHKMYSNNIVNSQESTTMLNASSKNVLNLTEYTTKKKPQLNDGEGGRISYLVAG